MRLEAGTAISMPFQARYSAVSAVQSSEGYGGGRLKSTRNMCGYAKATGTRVTQPA